MLKYAAIVPHSPLLLKTTDLNQDIFKAFKLIGSDLAGLEIANVLSISSHPRFERPQTSVYIHPEYKLDFREFGELAAGQTVSVWWDGFNCLRNTISDDSPELIDDEKIDYGHAVPLYHLLNQTSDDYKIRVLAVNINQDAGGRDYDELAALLNELKQIDDFAVFCSGDLCAADNPGMYAKVKQCNSSWRSRVSNHSLLRQEQPSDMALPCLESPLEILSRMLDKNFKYEELTYQTTSQTAYLAGRYTLSD